MISLTTVVRRGVALNGTGPYPQPMPAAIPIDELNMHRDVIPFHRDALELRGCRRELHPSANQHRGTLRSCGMTSKVNLYRR